MGVPEGLDNYRKLNTWEKFGLEDYIVVIRNDQRWFILSLTVTVVKFQRIFGNSSSIDPDYHALKTISTANSEEKLYIPENVYYRNNEWYRPFSWDLWFHNERHRFAVKSQRISLLKICNSWRNKRNILSD